MTVEVFDPRWAPVAAGAGRLARLCTGADWSEGPVWLPKSQQLLWSDIPNNRMLCWHREQGMQVWREAVEFTNGHALDADGHILHCSHGLRAILRTRLDAQGQPQADEVVVDRYQGRRLNSPNDVVVKSDGSIWFTDPPYGIVSDREGHKADSEIGANLVFRYSPADGQLEAVTDRLQEPNGLAFSPDESVLYITDTSAALRSDGSGHHRILSFEIDDGLRLIGERHFADIEPGLPDGIRVDVHGFVYTSSEDSVQVYHPDGTRVGRIPVPEKVGNLCFGGLRGDELFICASSSIYHLRLLTRGQAYE